MRRLAAWLLGVTIATPSCAADGYIRAQGRHLVQPGGTEFAIKGISLGNWLVPEGYMFKFHHALSPREIDAVFAHLLGRAGADEFWAKYRDTYITQSDINFIAAAGFNTVRVPLHWALFMRDGAPPRFEGPGWALIDRLIAWCSEAGLHVLLDLHAAPGGQTGVNHDDGSGFPLTFYVPRYRSETVALWHAIAARYAREPAVLGYDLLNEPISPYNDEDYLNPRLEPLYADIIAAIRSVDTNHAVFLAAPQWSTNFAPFGAPLAANAVYTYHEFWADPRRSAIQDYLNFSYRYNVPVFLGESGELTDRWNSKFRSLHERFGIGWSFWTYKEMASTSTVVSTRVPPGWQAIEAVGNAADPAAAPPVPNAASVMAAYLAAIRFENADVNCSYLASLGLHAPATPGLELASQKPVPSGPAAAQRPRAD